MNPQMQRMMAMYNNMKNRTPQQFIFNPERLNEPYKRTLVNQNMNQAKFGAYKQFPKFECTSVGYLQDCDFGETDRVCEVKVVHEHSLEVAEQYAEVSAPNYTRTNNMNPVILNVVGHDYTGDSIESSEDMRDEMINLRTTFCMNPKKGTFPIKEDHCVYTPYVNVIRPKDPRMPVVSWKYCYRVGIISATPIQQERAVNKMSSSHYIKTCTIIENIFQIAIAEEHQVLILTPFGHDEDNNPIEDIIQIYNFCIMKYGHKLKSIIIAIPPYCSKDIYNEYLENIVKPNELVEEIDEKYESLYGGLAIQNKIKEKMAKKSEYESDSEPSESEEEQDENENESEDRGSSVNFNPQMINPQIQQQFQQMFMNMMQANNQMMGNNTNGKKKKR
jgi:hypothetical protein